MKHIPHFSDYFKRLFMSSCLFFWIAVCFQHIRKFFVRCGVLMIHLALPEQAGFLPHCLQNSFLQSIPCFLKHLISCFLLSPECFLFLFRSLLESLHHVCSATFSD